MEIEDINRPYVLWRRVSTKGQGISGLGLEAQSTIATYFMHGEPVKTFTDVYSGTKLGECPNLAKAMKFCKETGYLLVVAKTDRFRNVKEALDVIDEMGEGNVTFCDLPTTNRMVLTIMFAVWENQAIMGRINTKRGLAEARKQGRVGGRRKGCDNSVAIEASAVARTEQSIRWMQQSSAVAFTRRKRAENWKVADIVNELGQLYDVEQAKIDSLPDKSKYPNPYATPKGCKPTKGQVSRWTACRPFAD